MKYISLNQEPILMFLEIRLENEDIGRNYEKIERRMRKSGTLGIHISLDSTASKCYKIWKMEL